jgi:A/G-specific adenine glycosylase
MPQSPPAALARRLLAWYDRHARRLPWRSLPGAAPADPYRVWLSEIMLQQTTVAAVESYFHKFTARWPTVEALAAAPLDDVLTAWAGLGYYARARNLHACAQALAARGGFPDTEEGLLDLPGIGAYTAAAIASIAFGKRAVVVDGNVLRVMARLFAVEDPLPGAKPKLTTLAGTLTPDARAGDYAQAVMDLGATICTPKSPACGICPWRDDCDGRRLGLAAQLPAKSPKAARPTRRGVAFWVTRQDGAVLLRRRPAKGLLGGMMEIPSTPWRAEPWAIEEALAAAPFTAQWTALPGIVDHVFTHFSLELSVVVARTAKSVNLEDDSEWWPVDRLDERALPSVMRKIVEHALAAEVKA